MRMLNYNDYRAARRFPALDGLRAVAALMVVFFHFGGPHWARLSGWSGVQVFFVLSGFLITTLALREEDRAGRISLRGFYLRRVFRILPVYLVVLAVLVGVYHARDQLRSSGTMAALPYYASTVLTDFAPPGGFIQSWTIGIEQKFYLLWPLLAFAAGAMSLARRAGLTIALLALSLAIMAAFNQGAAVHYATILIGCLLALLMHDRRTFRWVRPLTHPIAGVLIAAGFVAAQLSIQSAVSWFGGEPVVIAGYSVVVALLLPSLLNAGPLNWVLSRRPMTMFGERSYAVYLVQGLAGMVVIAVLGTHPGVTQVALTALVSLIMADVLHRWVERPMIDLGRRLTQPRRTAVRPVPAPVAPASPVPDGTTARPAAPTHAKVAAHPRATARTAVSATAVSPTAVSPTAVSPSVAAETVRTEITAPAGAGPLGGAGVALDSSPRTKHAEPNRGPAPAGDRTAGHAEGGPNAGPGHRDGTPGPHRNQRNRRNGKVDEPRPAPSRTGTGSS
ncbi:MAG TPA: acyltransferase family protein [Rugosimonospora sp.]|jgi:peptidoglycan/LPS O-acetylase OafA/YrhL